jgi:hypothetical protein
VTGEALIRQLNFFFSHFKYLAILRNPYLKKFIDSKLQIDPLAQYPETQTSLTILIPCTSKDFSILPTVIEAAHKNVRNPITEIVLVTPDKGLNLGDLKGVRILHDDSFLNTPEVRKILGDLDLNSSWINQQLIKILFCLQGKAENVLVLDADTVLTKPKYFISDKIQILSFAYEYHEPYMRQLSEFCKDIHDFGLTFVTHHQLWQKEIVEEIWGRERLFEWLSRLDRTELSPISEYHTYGLFTYNFFSDRVLFSRFGNDQYSRKILESQHEQIDEVLKHFPTSCSVSLHSYS